MGAALLLLVVLAMGGVAGWQSLLVFSSAVWVLRSHITRRWHWSNGHRSVSWLPASAVAAATALAGLVIATTIGPQDRGVAIYLGLTAGGLGGDVLDWVLIKRHDRMSAAP